MSCIPPGTRTSSDVRNIGALLFVVLSSCSDQPQAQRTDAPRKLGVVMQAMNYSFFVDLGDEIRRVAEEHGDQVVILDSQWNSAKQRNDISDLIHQNVAAIFVNPVNWEGVRGSLVKAQQQQIPCIIIDAPAKDEDLVLCQVASDNFEAGRMVAQELARVKRPSKIVVLHLSVNKACIDRVEGFKKQLTEYPDMQIVDTQEGKGTVEGARPVMRDLIGRYPDIDAVFAINDPSALGAISALDSAGKLEEVTVITVAGMDAGIEAIKAGRLHASPTQFPRKIGRAAAEAFYRHLEGEAVAKDIKVPVQMISMDNAHTYDD